MPSQQEVKWSQLKVGIIVLGATIVLTTLLFLMTSNSGLGFFSHKLTVTSYFENSAGLKVGAPVNLEGVTIGAVKTIAVVNTPDRKLTPVQVVMKIDGKYQSALHKDSTADLTAVGLLGDEVIDINSQYATGPMIEDGDELKTQEQPGLTDVMKASQGTIESLNVILAKLNTVVDNLQSGKGSFGQLLTNPQLYNKITAAADQLQTLTAKLNSDDNTVGKFFNDHGQMYDKIDDAVKNVDDITTDIHDGKGSIGLLLKDPTFANNLNHTISNLNELTSELQQGKGSMGMLLKDPTFARKLNDTLTQTDQLISTINSGQGTIGKLVKDDTTANNLNKLLTESTSLVSTIRQDPKKYLTIHLKIF
ncbi:MAG TPA: MlaD family protein [Acidobacteriaceae bacterium]|nr:MlaD family protein [Acidobacteriaceae bacterium]